MNRCHIVPEERCQEGPASLLEILAKLKGKLRQTQIIGLLQGLETQMMGSIPE
jgi:hypothetical protein